MLPEALWKVSWFKDVEQTILCHNIDRRNRRQRHRLPNLDKTGVKPGFSLAAIWRLRSCLAHCDRIDGNRTSTAGKNRQIAMLPQHHNTVLLGALESSIGWTVVPQP